MAEKRLATLLSHIKSVKTFKYRSTYADPNPSNSKLLSLSSSSPINRKYTTSGHMTSSYKLEVNGVNLHYERVGKGDHGVLLLPGALGSSRTDFQPQLEGLNQEKYTSIAFDPRGYGQSRPPDREWPLHFFQRDAEDALKLMLKLGYPHFSILGWSDGGITGMVLAGSWPSSVKKLLMWGSNAYLTNNDIMLFKGIEDLDKWSDRMRQTFLNVYPEDYLRSQLKQWAKAVTRIYTERNGDICVDMLPKIECKTLIVNGLKDPLVPQEHPIFLQKHIPNCRTIEWPNGKHNLHLRYHQEFNQTAEDFLDEPE